MKMTHFFRTIVLLFSLSTFGVFAQNFNNCYFECQKLYPYQDGLDSYYHSNQVNSCVNDCEQNQRQQREEQEQNERLEEQEDLLNQQENLIEEQVDENQELESRIKELERQQEELEFENDGL